MSEFIIYNGELYHHGVKGMKWGVRKTRKWATSRHQPSSARSSALAGLYAATGSKRIGKALDKSNDRDAENWERAKQDYKRIKADEKSGRGYVTTAQAKRNATKAANEARKKSIADSRANGPKGIGSFQKANRKALAAKRNAYDESMARDRAHNEQLKLTKKGEYKARKALTRAGTAFLTDKFMNEGVVTNAVSTATVQAGRAAVTAVVMARGGHDIKWYDKKGNRVG